MKRFIAWAMVAIAMVLPAAAADPQRATPDEAKAIVKKGIEHFRKVGRDRAMADFCKLEGPFIDRDLYVVVIKIDGLELAHINPKSVNKNVLDLRDADGTYLIKERLDAAKGATSGWQDYKFFNPVTKKIEAKRAYWERVDDLVFSSGAYKAL